MKISMIVAIAEGGVIGRGGRLPWHLSADLVRFKRLTTGHPIVMGRKTFESIGRVLPGRTSIVITRQADYGAPDGVLVASHLDEALEMAAALPNEKKRGQVFIIGGAEIYRAAMTRADRLCVTRVHARVEGDTFLPDLDRSDWKLMQASHHEPDERNDYAYSFEVYDRIRPDSGKI